VPSGVWRTLVGLGVDLGWSDAHLRSQHIPGSGTLYVIGLTVGSLALAVLTFGLVRPWGQVLPRWLPLVGGRRVPPSLTVGLALAGVALLSLIVVQSVLNRDAVSGFSDDPRSAWARLMVACYLPAVLWPLLLLAVTIDFWHRQRHR
jgi:hypothetical protein